MSRRTAQPGALALYALPLGAQPALANAPIITDPPLPPAPPAPLGVDWSVNAPAIPVIGALVFGGADPSVSGWTLLRSIPANPGRRSISVVNQSTDRVALVRDDGTITTAGAVPASGSILFLAPQAGSVGGSYQDDAYRGQIRIFAPASGASVYVWENLK